MGIILNGNQKCVSENSLLNWSGLKYFLVISLKWDGEFVEKEDRLLQKHLRLLMWSVGSVNSSSSFFWGSCAQKKSGPQTWSCPLCTRARLRKEWVLSVSTTWPGHSRVFKDITRHSFQRWLAPCVCPQSRVLGRPGVNCHCLALFRSCVIPLCYHEATWPLAFQDGTSSFHKL